jgi:hypothetical protein
MATPPLPLRIGEQLEFKLRLYTWTESSDVTIALLFRDKTTVEMRSLTSKP